MQKTLLLYLLLQFTMFKMIAQPSRTDYELNQKMKRALSFMEDKDYSNANTVFRNILATEKVLPNNLSYHFALTLYHIEQYRNSKSFLDKYLKLTGKGGDFYEEAKQLSLLLDEAFMAISECDLCDINGYKFLTCSFCKGQKSTVEKCTKCQAMGIIKCQQCKGEGVVITTNSFGENKYQTCNRCEGKAIHTCDLCNGQKYLNLVCNICLGTGQESSTIICTHSISH